MLAGMLTIPLVGAFDGWVATMRHPQPLAPQVQLDPNRTGFLSIGSQDQDEYRFIINHHSEGGGEFTWLAGGDDERTITLDHVGRQALEDGNIYHFARLKHDATEPVIVEFQMDGKMEAIRQVPSVQVSDGWRDVFAVIKPLSTAS